MSIKKYQLRDDGSCITASSKYEVAKKLRDSSKFDSHLSVFKYCRAFAQRLKIASGEDVRFDTTTNFVRDLRRIGWLTEVE